MADSSTDPPTVPPPSPPLSDDDTEISLTTLFEPTDECICDFGDIILNADDGFHPPQKLRVSSCILAMSSKVFKALFSRKFAEGQAGAGRSSERPHEVLVEDSPIPFKQLCRMLHHNRINENMPLRAREVFELALIADKYDTIEAISLQAQALLEDHMDEYNYTEGQALYYLIAAAMLFGQRKAFRSFTAELVLGHRNISASQCPKKVVELLPSSLLSSMCLQQSMAQQEFTTQVMSCTQQFSKACAVADRKSLCHAWVEALSGLSLMPPDFGSRSLKSHLEYFEMADIPVISAELVVNKPKAREKDIELVQVPGWPGYSRMRRLSSGSLVSYREEFEEVKINAPNHRTITRAIETVQGMCTGICLDCIRDKECETCSSKEDKELSEEQEIWDILSGPRMDW